MASAKSGTSTYLHVCIYLTPRSEQVERAGRLQIRESASRTSEENALGSGHDRTAEHGTGQGNTGETRATAGNRYALFLLLPLAELEADYVRMLVEDVVKFEKAKGLNSVARSSRAKDGSQAKKKKGKAGQEPEEGSGSASADHVGADADDESNSDSDSISNTKRVSLGAYEVFCLLSDPHFRLGLISRNRPRDELSWRSWRIRARVIKISLFPS